MTVPKPFSFCQYQKTRMPGMAKRTLATSRVHAAVKSGALKKPLCCERCGTQPEPINLQGHHADYDKPLEVEWLCKRCHTDEHVKLRQASEAARRARLRDPAHRIRKTG